MSYGDDFVFTLFTKDPELARRADRAGIDRIGLDIENMDKHLRQGHTQGWISDHRPADLGAIRDSLTRAKVFSRTNPIHPESRVEIEELLEAGAQVLMLPMFRTCAEVEEFVRLVDGRAEVSLLAETAGSMARMREIVRVPGIDEIHIGLNDMHLDLKLDNHFEVLVSGIMNMLAEIVRGAGIPFGFGGVARRGDTELPVDPDLVYAQYPRLGADRALITRAFLRPDYTQVDLDGEMSIARRTLDEWHAKPREELDAAFENLRRQVGGWRA